MFNLFTELIITIINAALEGLLVLTIGDHRHPSALFDHSSSFARDLEFWRTWPILSYKLDRREEFYLIKYVGIERRVYDNMIEIP